MKAQLILSPIRLGLVLSFFALCTMGLVIRLWYLQVYQHESFVQQAQNAHWDQETVTARAAPSWTAKETRWPSL